VADKNYISEIRKFDTVTGSQYVLIQDKIKQFTTDFYWNNSIAILPQSPKNEEYVKIFKPTCDFEMLKKDSDNLKRAVLTVMQRPLINS
jgi:hypothetical protein